MGGAWSPPVGPSGGAGRCRPWTAGVGFGSWLALDLWVGEAACFVRGSTSSSVCVVADGRFKLKRHVLRDQARSAGASAAKQSNAAQGVWSAKRRGASRRCASRPLTPAAAAST